MHRPTFRWVDGCVCLREAGVLFFGRIHFMVPWLWIFFRFDAMNARGRVVGSVGFSLTPYPRRPRAHPPASVCICVLFFLCWR